MPSNQVVHQLLTGRKRKGYDSTRISTAADIFHQHPKIDVQKIGNRKNIDQNVSGNHRSRHDKPYMFKRCDTPQSPSGIPIDSLTATKTTSIRPSGEQNHREEQTAIASSIELRLPPTFSQRSHEQTERHDLKLGMNDTVTRKLELGKDLCTLLPSSRTSVREEIGMTREESNNNSIEGFVHQQEQGRKQASTNAGFYQRRLRLQCLQRYRNQRGKWQGSMQRKARTLESTKAIDGKEEDFNKHFAVDDPHHRTRRFQNLPVSQQAKRQRIIRNREIENTTSTGFGNDNESCAETIIEAFLEQHRGKRNIPSLPLIFQPHELFEDRAMLPVFLIGLCALSSFTEWYYQKQQEEILRKSPIIRDMISWMKRREELHTSYAFTDIARKHRKSLAHLARFHESIEESHSTSLDLLSLQHNDEEERRHHISYGKQRETKRRYEGNREVSGSQTPKSKTSHSSQEESLPVHSRSTVENDINQDLSDTVVVDNVTCKDMITSNIGFKGKQEESRCLRTMQTDLQHDHYMHVDSDVRIGIKVGIEATEGSEQIPSLLSSSRQNKQQEEGCERLQQEKGNRTGAGSIIEKYSGPIYLNQAGEQGKLEEMAMTNLEGVQFGEFGEDNQITNFLPCGLPNSIETNALEKILPVDNDDECLLLSPESSPISERREKLIGTSPIVSGQDERKVANDDGSEVLLSQSQRQPINPRRITASPTILLDNETQKVSEKYAHYTKTFSVQNEKTWDHGVGDKDCFHSPKIQKRMARSNSRKQTSLLSSKRSWLARGSNRSPLFKQTSITSSTGWVSNQRARSFVRNASSHVEVSETHKKSPNGNQDIENKINRTSEGSSLYMNTNFVDKQALTEKVGRGVGFGDANSNNQASKLDDNKNAVGKASPEKLSQARVSLLENENPTSSHFVQKSKCGRMSDRDDESESSNTGGKVLHTYNHPDADFRYEEVVRGKAAREVLNGYECEECAAFFDKAVLYGDGAKYYDRDELLRCSRHRRRHTPPSTPQDFWELSFIDERDERLRKDSTHS